MIVTHQFRESKQFDNLQPYREALIKKEIFRNLADFISRFYEVKKEVKPTFQGLVTEHSIRLMVADEEEYLKFKKQVRSAIVACEGLQVGVKTLMEITVGKIFKDFESRQEIKPVEV